MHRVSDISLMATASRSITDASDPRSFVAMNQRSFEEWPFPYNDLGLLEAVKYKWRHCVMLVSAISVHRSGLLLPY